MEKNSENSNVRERKFRGVRRKSLRYAILTSISSGLAGMCMLSSPLQLFVIRLGASEIYLGLLSFFVAYAGIFSLFSIPKIDTIGKRAIMFRGWLTTAIIMLPMMVLPLIASKFPDSSNIILWLVLAILIIRGISDGYGSSAWMPILQDNVPRRITGKFFANLRVIWQGCLLLFMWALSFYLGRDASLKRFAVIFAIGSAVLFFRVITGSFIAQMPPKETAKRVNIRKKIASLLKYPALRTYLVYIVAINMSLFMAIPFQVKMLKNFDYSDGYIMFATSMTQLASIISLKFWGKISDRYGNRAVFSICVMGNMMSILLWILVDDGAFSKVFVFILYYLWGTFTAGNGIAQTRHMFHSSPKDDQASIVLISTVSSLSLAIAPLLGGILLVLTKDVVLKSGAITLNNYHLLYVVCAMLFLIPHTLRKKLRISKEDSTNYVMGAILRPLRQTLVSYLIVAPKNFLHKDESQDE